MATSEARLELFKKEYPSRSDVPLTWPDLVVVIGYFILIIGIGILVSIELHRLFNVAENLWNWITVNCKTSETQPISGLDICNNNINKKKLYTLH